MVGYDTMTRDIRWWQLIAVCILIAGVILTVWSAQQQDQSMRNDLLIKTNIAKTGISTGQLESLTGSAADLASPEYLAVKTQLKKIRDTDQSLRFAYLIGQRQDGTIILYADSEPPESEDYSPPGQVYTEAPAVLTSMFKTGDRANEGPYTDRWGTWVSGFIPVTDPATGRVIAVLGMDVNAQNWNQAILQNSLPTLIATLLIVLLVLVSAFFQRRSEEEKRRLATSEDKFSRAFHTNPALMAVSSIEEGRFLDVNSAFLKTLGYFREEVIGRTPSDLCLYSDPAQWDFIQSQLKETVEVRDVYIKVIMKNHNMLDGSFSAIKIDVAGNPCLLTVILDITERKRAEEALYMSQVMDGVPTRLSYVDADLRFVYVNNAYAEWYGRTINELKGKSVRDVKGEEVFLQDLPHYQMALSGKPVSFERMIPDTEGKEHFVIITLVPHYKGEQVTGFFASITDITERKRAEDELARKHEELNAAYEQLTASEEELRVNYAELATSQSSLRETTNYLNNLLDYANAPTIVWDPSQRITRLNHAFERLTGRTSNEVLGQPLEILFPPQSRENSLELIKKTIIGERWETVDIPILHVNGSIRTVLWNSATLLADDQTTVIATMAQGQDITERKLLETTLLRVNQKLNILSQLTRKDLANQIFVLNSYLELAKKQAAGQDLIIETVQKGVRAIRLIHETIEYSKDYQDMGAKPPKWQNVKMAQLFGLSHISIGNIQHSLETENLEIFADPLLEKVCQRLFENSVKHGDHVTRIRVWNMVTPDVVTIVFEDDGIGIPQELKEQIFLRGESAHASMRSLIFVREILDITGITIKENGEPGKGARFEMTVPKGAWRMTGKGS